jgi:hypothetical protein
MAEQTTTSAPRNGREWPVSAVNGWAEHVCSAQVTIWGNVLDFDCHDIAAAKLAIDGQVKQGEVAYSSLQQQSSSDRPTVLWS